MRKCMVVSLVIVLVFGTLSCSSMSRTTKGAATGAAVGGVVGGVIGHQSGNTAAGAIIGAREDKAIPPDRLLK